MKTVINGRYYLLAIMLFALITRLVFTYSADPLLAYGGGGDSGFYLQVGRDLVGGYDYSGIPIPVPPLYLLIVGIPQQFLSPENTIYLLWFIQSMALSLCCFFVYRVGICLTNDERVGLVAAFALATSISFAIQAVQIHTEAFYIFFILLALWLYIDGFLNENKSILRQHLCLYLAGAILGFAALTRPVLMLFPVGLAFHLLLIKRWKPILGFIVAYAFVFLSWTIYTSLYYDWTVIGSNQMLPAIWRGAVEGDDSPSHNDELLGGQTPLEQTTDIISSDPMGFVIRRVRELTYAYLQPYGTTPFGSESLKVLVLQWVDSGFSPDGFWQLLTGDGFIVKLLIYIWHYGALIGGIIGMWLTRKQWKISLVLIGFIAYTTLLHFVALALPRYIFPTYPIFWIFAAVAFVALWDTIRGKNKGAETNPPQI